MYVPQCCKVAHEEDTGCARLPDPYLYLPCMCFVSSAGEEMYRYVEYLYLVNECALEDIYMSRN